MTYISVEKKEEGWCEPVRAGGLEVSGRASPRRCHVHKDVPQEKGAAGTSGEKIAGQRRTQ